MVSLDICISSLLYLRFGPDLNLLVALHLMASRATRENFFFVHKIPLIQKLCPTTVGYNSKLAWRLSLPGALFFQTLHLEIVYLGVRWLLQITLFVRPSLERVNLLSAFRSSEHYPYSMLIINYAREIWIFMKCKKEAVLEVPHLWIRLSIFLFLLIR